ncbi:hypothetical protein ONZ45_g8346 [Pleurotus djamor]|nr:hypothetical protein ONZ45_g8346 [Pleurotus djamor]
MSARNKLVPFTREGLDDPPPIARTVVLSPKPHRIPSYGYAWRMPLKELRDNLAHYGPTGYDLFNPVHLEICIREQWKAQRHAERFGTGAYAKVWLIPYHNAEFEVFVELFSNSSQQCIDESQAQPRANEIIQASRELLRISSDTDKTLKWHCYNPIERYKPRI